MVVVHVFISQVDFLLTVSAFTTLVKPQRSPLNVPNGVTLLLHSQFFPINLPIGVERVVRAPRRFVWKLTG